MAQSYNVSVRYKTHDEKERTYIVSKKLAGIINLAVNSKKI